MRPQTHIRNRDALKDQLPNGIQGDIIYGFGDVQVKRLSDSIQNKGDTLII